ncbi:DUF2513 domain-containing protein [Cupriavidus necator]|nr:DUF2513 domain-containing protein [Cupriavidus necator]
MEPTMKRDWDLVREILTRLEGLNPNHEGLSSNQFDGYDPATVAYHFQMLNEAGLIIARTIGSMSERYAGAFALRLTWDGQEFLSKIRSDTVWSKVKKMITDKGIALGFDVIKVAATHYIKSQFPD